MLIAFALIALPLRLTVASRIWKHVAPASTISSTCHGNGKARGAATKPCGRHGVMVDFGRGPEKDSVQLGCYDTLHQINGEKAQIGTHGVCLIPNKYYCNEDDECRYGTSCRVTSRSGVKTCQTGSAAGTACDGDGSRRGDCANYHWAPVGDTQKWTYAPMYCIDMASLDPEHFTYTAKGEYGICKVWKGERCMLDDDCMFGLFCVKGTCMYDDDRPHTPSQAELVAQAAREARRTHSDKLDIEDGSGVTYSVMAPFALSLKTQWPEDQVIKRKLDDLYQSLQDAFVSVSPVKVGGASRSGSKLYASSDRRWILKQVRKNEFKTLAGPVHEEVLSRFQNGDWWVHNGSSLGIQGGSLINLPVLTINPGHWVVLRNVSDHHYEILQQRNFSVEVMEKFDVKPPPARSDGREQFLSTLLTFNGGEGLHLEKMVNFYRYVRRYLYADLKILRELHLVDYSILVELYVIGDASIDVSDLGQSCIAEDSCSAPDGPKCVIACFSIIDWLRPFLPGMKYSVEIENSLKGGKFSDYAGKATLLLDCISSFGHTPYALQPDNVNPFVGETMVPIRTNARYPDSCSSRWKIEQGVEMNLVATACKPFLKARVEWTSTEGVSEECAISLTKRSYSDVCLNRDYGYCREGESCSFMMLGQSLGCYPIPLLGTPRMETLISQCSAYIGELCDDKALRARESMCFAGFGLHDPSCEGFGKFIEGEFGVNPIYQGW